MTLQTVIKALSIVILAVVGFGLVRMLTQEGVSPKDHSKNTKKYIFSIMGYVLLTVIIVFINFKLA